jgi:hypothetical protein
VSEFYEPLLESCMAAVALFASERDEEAMAAALSKTRDALLERRRGLGGDRA